MLLHIVSSPKPGLGTKLIVLPTSLTAAQGWDVLLRAFLSAFTAADNVLLLLHTKPFHSEPDFPQQMQVQGACCGSHQCALHPPPYSCLCCGRRAWMTTAAPALLV